MKQWSQMNKHPYFSPPSHAQVRHHPAACELDAMQVRKIDCKPTRQRNQSSSPEKRLIWIVSFYFFFLRFLRCGNSNRKKKYLRAVTKTTVTTWAESHWGYEALLLYDPDCQVRLQTPILQFLGAVLRLPWLQCPGPPSVCTYVRASRLIF